MLPINESGEITTIENVFHSLNTRLNSITNGNLDSGYGYSYKESIMEIESKIFGFPPAKAFPEINYSLGLIHRIQESKILLIEDDRIIEDNSNQIDDSWSNSTMSNEQIKIVEINEELNQYKLFLEKIQNELLIRLSSNETLSDINFEKVAINIGIEEFAGLVFFLSKKGIFKGSYKSLCREIVKLFSLKSGIDMKLDSLYNKGYNSFQDGKVFDFWKPIFSDYLKQSYLLPKK